MLTRRSFLHRAGALGVAVIARPRLARAQTVAAGPEQLAQLVDPASDPDRRWEQEHDQSGCRQKQPDNLNCIQPFAFAKSPKNHRGLNRAE